MILVELVVDAIEGASRPLPHVADHVVKTIAVWRERLGWGGAKVSILLCVFDRKLALCCCQKV